MDRNAFGINICRIDYIAFLASDNEPFTISPFYSRPTHISVLYPTTIHEISNGRKLHGYLLSFFPKTPLFFSLHLQHLPKHPNNLLHMLIPRLLKWRFLILIPQLRIRATLQ